MAICDVHQTLVHWKRWTRIVDETAQYEADGIAGGRGIYHERKDIQRAAEQWMDGFSATSDETWLQSEIKSEVRRIVDAVVGRVRREVKKRP